MLPSFIIEVVADGISSTAATRKYSYSLRCVDAIDNWYDDVLRHSVYQVIISSIPSIPSIPPIQQIFDEENDECLSVIIGLTWQYGPG
jgi:hypothetical protein